VPEQLPDPRGLDRAEWDVSGTELSEELTPFKQAITVKRRHTTPLGFLDL
jgi:hypothetical protein